MTILFVLDEGSGGAVLSAYSEKVVFGLLRVVCLHGYSSHSPKTVGNR